MNLSERAAAFIKANPDLAREIAQQLQNRRPVAGLTGRQSEALSFIKGYQAERGKTPCFEEIMEALGLASKAGVHRIVCALEERGYIDRMPGRARSIVLREAA